uniref:Cation efflux protein transmembrane domain-containing protein n=1 Tax=Timema shepardi TaxID=629360 RepID=A0A7R9B114_TIMSH|nr:unnamed protein product [Timema shepardi]
MFFDCTGLLAGLAATVITRWRADDKFSYGYVRAEVLAGFVNGLFLLFIAFFIMSEAVERAIEPPEVKHERLFVVSVLGLLVNLVGIYAFQHGHGHSHGGSSHGHSHGGGSSHSHNNVYNHGHDVGDFSGSDSQIMKGVFLHILADTLGSVGVIVSAVLMQMFGWMIADPICSMFIALLIAISVLALIKDSVLILMQRQPAALDGVLPQCYQKVACLAGVYSIQEPHFWTLCSDVYVGAVKLEVSKEADHKYISLPPPVVSAPHRNCLVKGCFDALVLHSTELEMITQSRGSQKLSPNSLLLKTFIPAPGLSLHLRKFGYRPLSTSLETDCLELPSGDLVELEQNCHWFISGFHRWHPATVHHQLGSGCQEPTLFPSGRLLIHLY